MVEKYIYKQIHISGHDKEVHYGTNKIHTYTKYIKSYKRKQRYLNPEYVAKELAKKHGLFFKSSGTGKYKDMLANQVLHQDWSHMSEKYPNVIGLTDLEIQTFLDTFNYDQYNIGKEGMEQYIKQLRCYNDNDITKISQNMHDEWQKRMSDYTVKHFQTIDDSNRFENKKTIFITSPRGGNQILTIFSYANYGDVSKSNIPFDWEQHKKFTNDGYKQTLKTVSMPYEHNYIKDVNDIVYLDDIFMSGEQFGKALSNIKSRLEELQISNEQLPRIHYMSIAGNMPRIKDKEQIIDKPTYKQPTHINDLKWFTYTVGDKRKFDHHYDDPYPFTSACVFPFSIPDGNHHKYARKLYDKFHKFPHRKYT
jgi:hypothetical protein